MKKFTPVLIIICFVVLPGIWFFTGCSHHDSEFPEGHVGFWVTEDFGNQVLFSDSIEVSPGESVISLLQQHLEVEAEYGGGFVNSINGLVSGYTKSGDSGERLDWFYSVNGIMADIGAAAYYPVPGDAIWWDYHSWDNSCFTPAVIGAFPQPFLNGYRGDNPGTVILAGNGCRRLANQMAEYLSDRGADAVEVKPYEENLAACRSGITMVIALWEELDGSRFWQEMQNQRDKTGWFVQLEKGQMYTLDAQGNKKECYEQGAGAVLATGSGLGDSNPLWLITGLDMEGLNQITDVMLEHPEYLAKRYGAVVIEEKVIGLPR